MYKHTRVVRCKKPLERAKYSRKETILKIGHLAKAMAMQSLCKMVSLGEKLKWPKRWGKRL